MAERESCHVCITYHVVVARIMLLLVLYHLILYEMFGATAVACTRTSGKRFRSITQCAMR